MKDTKKTKVCQIFSNTGVNIESKDIQECHRLKGESENIVKLSNWKGCSKILRVQRELKNLVAAEVDFPNGSAIYIDESLCLLYHGIWNKFKKENGLQTPEVITISVALLFSRH